MVATLCCPLELLLSIFLEVGLLFLKSGLPPFVMGMEPN